MVCTKKGLIARTKTIQIIKITRDWVDPTVIGVMDMTVSNTAILSSCMFTFKNFINCCRTVQAGEDGGV